MTGDMWFVLEVATGVFLGVIARDVLRLTLGHLRDSGAVKKFLGRHLTFWILFIILLIVAVATFYQAVTY